MAAFKPIVAEGVDRHVREKIDGDVKRVQDSSVQDRAITNRLLSSQANYAVLTTSP